MRQHNASPERLRQLYQLGAGFDMPEPPPPPPAQPEPLRREPPNEAALNKKWELARLELEQAAEWGRLPDVGSDFLYSPHLGVLKKRILRSWQTLDEVESVRGCVAVIRKMKDDVGATLYGFAILSTALLEADLDEQAEAVADLQVQYLKDLKFSPGLPDIAEEREAETDPPGAEE
jgi:hypothetical protein